MFCCWMEPGDEKDNKVCYFLINGWLNTQAREEVLSRAWHRVFLLLRDGDLLAGFCDKGRSDVMVDGEGERRGEGGRWLFGGSGGQTCPFFGCCVRIRQRVDGMPESGGPERVRAKCGGDLFLACVEMEEGNGLFLCFCFDPHGPRSWWWFF